MTIKELFAPSDMTVGKPWEKIVAFTIPMLIGNIAQQLYNTVDSIVIGKYVGDNALAAVGSASPILNLLLVLFVGISVVAGVSSDHHVTLKFGLMRNAHAWKIAVDEVLSGWQIPDVLHVTEISSFASPLPDAEPYRCIIMKPYAGALLEAHQRLSMLPHIDTHASYVPHITLGYVQEQHAARAIERLDHLCMEQQLSCKVLGMNYGDPPN